jgi:hypothetical protein
MMAELEKMDIVVPGVKAINSVKARKTISLTGTDKSNWIEVPADQKGLFINFAIRFDAAGSCRLHTTNVSRVEILNASDPDSIPFNTWPKGTVSEADILPLDSYIEDSRATVFTAFRFENISGTSILEAVTN